MHNFSVFKATTWICIVCTRLYEDHLYREESVIPSLDPTASWPSEPSPQFRWRLAADDPLAGLSQAISHGCVPGLGSFCKWGVLFVWLLVVRALLFGGL